MKLTKFFALSLSILFLSLTNLNAQSRVLDKANYAYQKLAFDQAIEHYEDYLSERYDPAAAFNLGKAYLQVRNFEKSAYWLGQSVNDIKVADAYLYYAQALQGIKEYDKAYEQYQNYHKANPLSGLGTAGMLACKRAPSLLDQPQLFALKNTEAINSIGSDFGVSFFKDGLLMTSDRDRYNLRDLDNPRDGGNFYDMYYVGMDSTGNETEPTLFKASRNTILNDGPVAYSEDEEILVFSTNQYTPFIIRGFAKRDSNNIVREKLMYQRRNAFGKWSKPMDFQFTNPDYTFSHPAFNAKGDRVYFASDMPGGKGGTDIWFMDYLGDDVWSEPINVTMINTPGNEMFPSIDPNEILYFSSDGYPGCGGMDVFRAVFSNDAKTFVDAINLGAPINTPSDDFHLNLGKKGRKGYLSSNRGGGTGSDDIYSVKYQGSILDVTFVNGENLQPVHGVTFKAIESSQEFTDRMTETNQLYYPIENSKTYTFKVIADGYAPQVLHISGDSLTPGGIYPWRVSLNPDPTTTIKGLTVEGQSKLPLENTNVRLYNLLTGNYRDTVSDEKGLFFLPVYPGVSYALVGFKNGYDLDSVSFSTAGLGLEDTISKRLVLGEGDRVYTMSFNNIYFDYDKASLRPEAVEELNKMLDILNISSDLKVEVSAHTDSRGSKGYNQRLSDRRAKSVVNYLVAKGISKDRIKPKGYGETRLVNDCGDGSECTEQQHQLNRRVEFAVLDENGNVIREK